MEIRFIDLFCGIGGFRYAMQSAAKANNLQAKCVLSSDIDPNCQKAYAGNFGDMPIGDIQTTPSNLIPDHDILLAGFPCQPFSIIGSRKGFEDARGTLFFEIARILECKKPTMFVLENVKLLAGHNNGKTLSRVLEVLRGLGYFVDFKILNALDFGLPQRRERIFIVGLKGVEEFSWPQKIMPMKPLSQILEKSVPKRFFASSYIREKRNAMIAPTTRPTIWHENKSGHVSAYPYSCALRAGASYNYLLVNGERRLTPREMLRLQGFPDSFKIVCNDSQTRKQAGNSLPIPVAEAVINRILLTSYFKGSLNLDPNYAKNLIANKQMVLFEKSTRYGKNSKIKNRRKIQSPIPA